MDVGVGQDNGDSGGVLHVVCFLVFGSLSFGHVVSYLYVVRLFFHFLSIGNQEHRKQRDSLTLVPNYYYFILHSHLS